MLMTGLVAKNIAQRYESAEPLRSGPVIVPDERHPFNVILSLLDGSSATTVPTLFTDELSGQLVKRESFALRHFALESS
jgi:hypothetical protein